MSEARNLRNMTQAQTPLLGEQNTPLHGATDGGTGFAGATPRHSVAFTPNPLATPLRRSASVFDPSATPRSDTGSVSVSATPMRDSLSINEGEPYATGDTPREQRLRANAAKHALKLGFSSLPKPLNDFEVEMPEDEEEDADNEDSARVLSVEDAAERDARIKRRQEEEARKALARRSAVVQKGLPRPAVVDADELLRRLSATDGEEVEEVQRLMDIEFVRLLEHDSIAYPLPGTIHPGSTQSSYEHPDDHHLAIARATIHAELAQSLGFPDANEEQIKEGINLIVREEDVRLDAFGWAKIRPGLAYDARSKTWVEPASLSREERIAGFSALLEEDREAMAAQSSKLGKTENKLGVTLGGYQARGKVLAKRLTDAFAELQKTKIDLECFSRLGVNESATGPRRVQALQEEVDRLEKREKLLQSRYRELDEDRREIGARLAAKEEMLMAEAEAVNEAALAALDDATQS